MELMSPDTQWLSVVVVHQPAYELVYPETPKLAHSLASLGNPAEPLITTCTQSLLGSLTALGLTSFQPQRYRRCLAPQHITRHLNGDDIEYEQFTRRRTCHSIS